MTGDLCFVLEMVPLRGEKNFKPHPQNMILVALRGYVQTKLLMSVHVLFIWQPPRIGL